MVEGGIVDLATGAILTAFSPPLAGSPAVVDVDPEPGLEIVSANQVLSRSGKVLSETALTGRYVAVADLDGDASPEIVTVQSAPGEHGLVVWRPSAGGAEIVRSDVDLFADLPDPCGGTVLEGGGPPVVADFDGNGHLDVGVATPRGLVVLDGAALVDPSVAADAVGMFTVPYADCAGGRRGASAFDFDADGAPEIVVADGTTLRIVDGKSQTVEYEACLVSEPSDGFPFVADADSDGFAEIVAPASSRFGGACGGEPQAGVRLFGHPGRGWALAPAVWNEHGYHGTNVGAEGDLTIDETPHYASAQTNGFRLQRAIDDAPDLGVQLVPDCGALVASVRNLGTRAVRAGRVEVAFYEGTAATHGAEVAIVSLPIELSPGTSALLSTKADHPAGIYAAEVRARQPYQPVDCNLEDNVVSGMHCP